MNGSMEAHPSTRRRCRRNVPKLLDRNHVHAEQSFARAKKSFGRPPPLPAGLIPSAGMAAVEDMSFEELVEILAAFEQENEPSNVDRAIHRTTVERRLMSLLSAGAAQRDLERRAHIRVPGDVKARIHRDHEAINATVKDLAEGGVRLVSAWGPAIGATIDLELLLKQQLGTHSPRAQAIVTWVQALRDDGYEFGAAFLAHDDAHRRRMRRVVVELLRRIPQPGLH
jgi:hypothetical protein